jgi:hypothetical protein
MQKIYFFKRSKISNEILAVKKYLASFCLLLLTLLFSTSGNLASAQSLNENFDGTTFPPTGWVSQSVLGTNTWGRSTLQFRSSPASAFVNYQSTGGNDWLFTPSNLISGGDSLEFFFKKNFPTTAYPPDSLIIWSGSGQSIAAMDTVIARIDVANSVGANWNRVAIPVGYASGTSRVFGFQHKNTDGNGVFLDDVRLIKPAGTNCDFPIVASLPFSQTGYNTANFGNNITFSPCNQSYINGDDIVFQFTAPGTGFSPVRIATANSGTWIGLHVTSTCPQSATVCNAYIGQSAVNPVLDAPLIGGQTYFLTVSTWPAPQSAVFDLTITALSTDTIIASKIKTFLERKGLEARFVEYFAILTAPTFLSFLQEEEMRTHTHTLVLIVYTLESKTREI